MNTAQGRRHESGGMPLPRHLQTLELTAYNRETLFQFCTDLFFQETPVSDITLAQAKTAIDAAFGKAQQLGAKMNIAVVDAGANLKAFRRMDGAWLGSIDVSIRKARTARYFDMPTGEIGKLSQPGGSLFAIEHSNGGLITFPGGVPIVNAAGEVIGAIGVSGSTVENDHEVASFGAAAVK
jgi:uncharacterized protein GlcG (DUF336 family)